MKYISVTQETYCFFLRNFSPTCSPLLTPYFPARNLSSLNSFKSTVPSEVISCLCSFMSEFPCCISFFFLQYADSDLNLTDADLLAPAEKQRRAHREYIASITLDDIAQYFHLPIRDASRTLKIGLSILKKKCRQYGIPRWPHRKLKSLDSLIHDLEVNLTAAPSVPPHLIGQY